MYDIKDYVSVDGLVDCLGRYVLDTEKLVWDKGAMYRVVRFPGTRSPVIN